MQYRRFKIGMVSMHIVASWGKDIGDQIKIAISDDTKILRQQDNFERATLDILLYDDSFTVIGGGCEIPRTILEIPYNDKTNILTPKIILPRY